MYDADLFHHFIRSAVALFSYISNDRLRYLGKIWVSGLSRRPSVLLMAHMAQRNTGFRPGLVADGAGCMVRRGWAKRRKMNGLDEMGLDESSPYGWGANWNRWGSVCWVQGGGGSTGECTEEGGAVSRLFL